VSESEGAADAPFPGAALVGAASLAVENPAAKTTITAATREATRRLFGAGDGDEVRCLFIEVSSR
jgi:hypothetical protein